MRFFEWVFNIRTRHRLAVEKYEDSAGGKILSLVMSLIFIALSFATEFFLLKTHYDGGADLGNQALILVVLGLLSAALLLATLDYITCFVYFGIRTAILGDDYGGSRLVSLLLGFIQLALGVALIIGEYLLLIKFTEWFA